MREWNVYVNGAYYGTVHESTEALARAAALSKFTIGSGDELMVSPR